MVPLGLEFSMVFFAAVATVAKFAFHCKTHGWSTKPEYSPHLTSALSTGLGWEHKKVWAFCAKFALDFGGAGATGPGFVKAVAP